MSLSNFHSRGGPVEVAQACVLNQERKVSISSGSSNSNQCETAGLKEICWYPCSGKPRTRPTKLLELLGGILGTIVASENLRNSMS